MTLTGSGVAGGVSVETVAMQAVGAGKAVEESVDSAEDNPLVLG